MGKQFIITISREYGSGGHEMGMVISGLLGVPMYDRDIIREIAKELDMDAAELEKYDEKPKNLVASRRIRSQSNSMEEILHEKQAAWIKMKADSGESFVVVGRRAKEVLENHPGMISFFVTADENYKVERIMADRSLDRKTAQSERQRIDRIRKSYHNRYSDYKWGDSRYYDLIVNSAKLGASETARLLLPYIQARIDAMEE